MTALLSLNSMLKIEREASIVRIVIKCIDEYEAMLLYDSLCRQAQNGRVSLSVDVIPKATK